MWLICLRLWSVPKARYCLSSYSWRNLVHKVNSATLCSCFDEKPSCRAFGYPVTFKPRISQKTPNRFHLLAWASCAHIFSSHYIVCIPWHSAGGHTVDSSTAGSQGAEGRRSVRPCRSRPPTCGSGLSGGAESPWSCPSPLGHHFLYET